VNEKIKKIPAVVLGLSANGLSVARSLGRKGIPVIGLDDADKAPAKFSRYVKKYIHAPHVENGIELLRILLSISQSFSDKPVLLATADEYVAFVSDYRMQLSDYFRFLLPLKQTVDDFLDKQKTADFCIKKKIPHPQTYFLESGRPWENIIQKIVYPAIVKPQDSHVWRQYYDEKKVFVVHSSSELTEVDTEIRQHQLNIIVQEIIPGKDSDIYQFLAFCNDRSEMLASFCCHKIRQYPPDFGIACLCESVREPKVIEAGKKLLSNLYYKGMIALEFKMDERTKAPVFLEANLRTSFFGELAVASGVDFPYIIYRYLVFGDEKPHNGMYEKGVKLWNIELDLGHLVRVRKEKEITFLQWVKDLKSWKIAHTYFAFDDLKPWIVVYARFLKTIILKTFKLLAGQEKKTSQELAKQSLISVMHLISSSGFFGAESVLMTLAKNVQDEKYVPIVGAFKDRRDGAQAEIIARARESGLETFLLECSGRFDLWAAFRLRKYLTENKINVLHTHNYKADVIGALAARMGGIPIVATAHGFTDMTASVSFYEKLDRLFLRMFFDRVVTVTDKMLPALTPRRKRVIPNGINTDFFNTNIETRDAFRRKYNIREDDMLVGTIGRLSKEKDQIMFLEALEPLMRDEARLKIIIVGSGPKEMELKEFVTAKGLSDRVVFTGIIKDVGPVYMALDVFVLSSLTEGVPLTVLEAMASGLPVVATKVGGIPQMIEDGRNGLLIEPRNREALREKIGQLLKDPSRRKSLGASGQAFVRENYSLESMCEAYKKVYDEVLES